MKKFLKTITMALVFCLSLTTLVACGGNQTNAQTQDSPATDAGNNNQEHNTVVDTPSPETPATDTPDTDTPTPDDQGCRPDCDCQSPVVCDHIICEHEWEVWFTAEHKGKLVTFSRCAKNPEHVTYEISDIVTDPDDQETEDPGQTDPEPEITFDADYLGGTTWESNNSDKVPLVFNTDGTYRIFDKYYGKWEIKDNIVTLYDETPDSALDTDVFELIFDITSQTLSGSYGSFYTFVLTESVVK